MTTAFATRFHSYYKLMEKEPFEKVMLQGCLKVALTYKGPFTRVMFRNNEGLPLNVYFKTLELLILAE